MPVVDGTVPRLLVNKGLVGLSLFCYLWFISYLARFRRNTAVSSLLLFAAINSLNGETLLTSYRSIQVYIPLLIAAAYLGGGRTLASHDPADLESARVRPGRQMARPALPSRRGGMAPGGVG
jgi:hypothetical protein